MEPGASRDERYATLLQTASGLTDAEERRAFLQQVCPDEPALAAELLETITLQEREASRLTPSRPFAAGAIVADRFQILRPLGQGGMAVVYEAWDQKLQERRALKFPKAGHSRSIPPEARSALRVTHQNICRTHEIHTAATEAGPADFISMEFLEGETLLRRWSREPIPADEAVEIAVQLCRGLDAAHRANILHRDLKSSNVMLARNSDGGLRLVITDFGLAQPLATGERSSASSTSGTPAYMAPERWKGVPATAAADVYALGVVLYEMLAGRLPFSQGKEWLQRLNGLPQPPSKSERAVDPRWDSIVLRCLEPDPARRFASAGEVLQAIEGTFRSHRRRNWLIAAAVFALAVSPMVVWRDRIWPPPLARLAVLPFTGSGVNEAVRGGLYDLAGRLESLGAASKRVAVLPLEDSIRYDVNSPALAASRLGATHALSGTINAGDRGFSVSAVVTDLRRSQPIREFTGEFQASDLAGLSTSLAGVVSSAFRLDKAPPASISPAAYATYAAGLASLRGAPPNADQAIASFETALQADGSSPLIHSGLAEAWLKKFSEKHDAQWLHLAAAAARRAESLNPDSPSVLVVLGSVEREQGHLDQAIQHLQRAAEIEPNNADAWRRIGLALQGAGRQDEGIRALITATMVGPGYYAPHLDLGSIYVRAGRYSEAVEEFKRVTQLAPELPDGFAYLGGALLVAERDAEAEQALRRSLQLRETRAAWNNLSVLLRYQARDREAAQALEQALRVGADDSFIRLNLANALRRSGDAARARENFQHANDLARATLLRNPRDARARSCLAYSMVHLGSPSLAADEALQAVRLTPADYSVLFWSVMTLESLGRRDDAFPLLTGASQQRLRDLRRQPDLAGFTRDPRFIELLRKSEGEKKDDARPRDH